MSITRTFHKHPGLLVLATALLSFSIAQADCTSPAYPAGSLQYFTGTSEYKLCDGTNWKALDMASYDAGSCSVAAAMDYDSAIKSYKVCNGTEYREINCGAGTTPTATVTAKGTANNKTAMATWTPLSSVALSAGDTLLVCAASKDSLANTWKYVSSGLNFTCGIKSDDTLFCWGSNGYGQLGDNTTSSRTLPTAVNGGGTWKSVSNGATHTCAIKSDDTAWCWGYNYYGEVGDNTTVQKNVPTAVSGGSTWKAIGAGNYISCGIKSDDTLWCWGDNYSGALGDNTTTNRTIPTAVSGGGTWKSVSVGYYHVCAIKSDDGIYCWGWNYNRQLGDNTTTDRWVPTAIYGGGTWKMVAAGGFHTCAIKSDDTMWCWGNGNYGQLGRNSATSTGVPSATTGGWLWKSVNTGMAASCAIRNNDRMYCFGYNVDGAMGDNTTTNRFIPTEVYGGSTWVSPVAVGGNWVSSIPYPFSCGIKADSGLYCWGYGVNGQLGDNASTSRLVPTQPTGGITWNSLPLSQVAAIESGGVGVYIYALTNAPAATGNIVAYFGGTQSATGKAITATAVTNLATAYTLDQTATAISTGTTPSSGNTPTTLQATEFLFGCIATNGPVGDTAGTWSNSFVNGQRDGSTGSSATGNMTAHNGSLQVSSTGTYAAAQTSAPNRGWNAAIATFRVAKTCTTYGACSGAGKKDYSAGNGMRVCDGSNWVQWYAP